MPDQKIESADSIYGQAGISDATAEAPFFGASTFMRRPYSRDLADVDIAILGVPFDLAVCNRPGSRFGPTAIRMASRDMSSWEKQYPWGFNPFKRLRVVDYGDVIYRYGNAAAMVDCVMSAPLLRVNGRAYNPRDMRWWISVAVYVPYHHLAKERCSLP